MDKHDEEFEKYQEQEAGKETPRKTETLHLIRNGKDIDRQLKHLHAERNRIDELIIECQDSKTYQDWTKEQSHLVEVITKRIRAEQEEEISELRKSVEELQQSQGIKIQAAKDAHTKTPVGKIKAALGRFRGGDKQ